MRVYAKDPGEVLAMSKRIWYHHIATYPSSVAVNYLKTESTYLSSQIAGRSVNTAVYDSTSDKSAFSTILLYDLEMMYSSLVFKSGDVVLLSRQRSRRAV